MPRSRTSLLPALLVAVTCTSQYVPEVAPGIAKLVAAAGSCLRFHGLRPGHGAVAYEAAGQRDQAIAQLEGVLKTFPNPRLQRRLDALKAH